jgi:hypothetical protein
MGRDHGEAEVERIVQQCLERFGLSETDLESLPGSDPRKVSIARFLHQSTTTPKGWTAERLRMKNAANVSQFLSRAKRLKKRKSSQQNQLSSQDLLTDPFCRFPGDWMKPKITRDKLERLWRDPVNWKRGLIYSCKDDPRIVVPKKQKWRGWTINFAHRRATPTLILMILAAGLPVFLLAIFGLARMPIWWACLFLTMAIICLVCWYHHSLCPTRHGWDYSVVFYGIIPSNPLTSLTIARQTRNHGKFLLAGKVWPFWAK